MPKRKSGSVPTKKRDGNYDVIYLNSEKIRLGRVGTEEADREYRRIVAEWLNIGGAATSHKKESYLIDDLAFAFLLWAESVYGDSDFGNYKTAIVMGCESAGLTGQWNAPDILAVKIPMLGLADSLNISNAAAILFYEARRQRTATKL